MMSSKSMNDRRSAWADEAINTFVDTTQTDREDALSDLLCDMMHWCDRNEFDFSQELEMAESHYDYEKENEE